MAIDDQLASLLAQNADLFATYEEWSNSQVMLLAGSITDPASFDINGGKTGPLGYYPVVNVSGQTIYVACMDRLRHAAIDGVNDALAAVSVVGDGLLRSTGAINEELRLDVVAATPAETIAGTRTDVAVVPTGVRAAVDQSTGALSDLTNYALGKRPRVDAPQNLSDAEKTQVLDNIGAADRVALGARTGARWVGLGDGNVEAAIAPITLNRIGCTTGRDFAYKLNQEIRNNAPGTPFQIPGVNGDSLADQWLSDEPVSVISGVNLAGHGYSVSSGGGSIIHRTGAFPLLTVEGQGGGGETVDLSFLRQWSLRDLAFNGGAFDADMLTMLNCGQFELHNVFMDMGAQRRLIFIKGQTQDGVFRHCTFNHGGTTDGSIAAIEIDETLSDGGHNQNLLFDDCTWEAYYGTGLRISGLSKQGLPNSLIELRSCKLESPTRSNVRDIEILNGKDIVLDLRLLLGKGTSGIKSEMIYLKDCQRIRISGHLGFQNGGAALQRLITAENTTYSDIDIDPATNEAVTALTADHIVYLSTDVGNRVKCSYLGPAGAQKRLTNIQQASKLVQTRVEILPLEAVFGVVARTNGFGVVQSSNRAVEVKNAAGSAFFGFDPNNNFGGSPTANIGGGGFALDPLTGQGRFTSIKFGFTAADRSMGQGDGDPNGRDGNVSDFYLRRDGAVPGSTLYVKESNLGTTTGWVQIAIHRTGLTANRPSFGRYPGMQYYDTTLGKPIWWNAVAGGWRDAMGTAV